MLKHNSPTPKGGTIIYVSNSLKYIERNDIKFDHPKCEACFVEIMCENAGHNPIFGALYRHPCYNTSSFNSYLGEFLENFTSRKTKLTILGDVNIDLNKSNPGSNEYVSTINSAGFSTLINQPTRIFYYETTNHVSCSTLDHIITNSSPMFSKSGILVADISDHLPVFGFISLTKPCIANRLKNTFRRNFQVSKKRKIHKMPF